MYDTTPFAYDAPQPPRPQKKWYQRKIVLIPSGIVGAFLLIGIVGAATGAGEQKDKPVAAPASVAPVTVERTVTAPAPTPSSSSVAVAVPVVESTAAPVSKAAPATKRAPRPKVADGWTMPDEVGNDLQGAQDHIQSVTGDAIFFTDSVDATGADRLQVLDRNWQVCSQNISAGSRITADSDIVFSVVKLEESCP